MKKYVSVLLAILMLLLAGCQSSQRPQTTANLEQNDPMTMPTTTAVPTTQATQPQEDYILAPAPLYAEKQKELEDAWVAAGNAPLEGWYIKDDPDTIWGSYYLGSFDGCDVLYIRLGNDLRLGSYAGYAYKDGEFLELGDKLEWGELLDENLLSEENADTVCRLAKETRSEVTYLYLDSQPVIYGPAPLELEKRLEIEAVMKELLPKWPCPTFTSIVDGQIVCSGLVYYGCFDGCDVFFETGMMDACETKRFGNAEFSYTGSFALYAYKNGELTFMEYAYPDGWISDEGIEQAAQAHREYMEQYEPNHIPSD